MQKTHSLYHAPVSIPRGWVVLGLALASWLTVAGIVQGVGFFFSSLGA